MLRYYVVHTADGAFEYGGERALAVCLRAMRFAALQPEWIDAETLYSLLSDGLPISRTDAKHVIDVALRTLIESHVDVDRERRARLAANGIGAGSTSRFGVRSVRFQARFVDFLRRNDDADLGETPEEARSESRRITKPRVMELLNEREQGQGPARWHDEFASAIGGVMTNSARSEAVRVVLDALRVYCATATREQMQAAVDAAEQAVGSSNTEVLVSVIGGVARTMALLGKTNQGACCCRTPSTSRIQKKLPRDLSASLAATVLTLTLDGTSSPPQAV